MSRRGFLSADIDVMFFYDAKVRRLASRSRDHAISAYLQIVLASWHAGHRKSAEEVLENGYIGCVVELQRVGLLGADGRVPESTWDGWYGPAFERREASAERQRAYRARRSEGTFREQAEAHGAKTL
jgi:hypothetical protein